jgi:TPR repeat protein
MAKERNEQAAENYFRTGSDLLEKAAKSSDPSENYNKGWKQLKLAADNGNYSAQIAVARVYKGTPNNFGDINKVVPVDQKQAFKYYLLASAYSNDIEGIVEVAKAYESGVGTTKNLQKALEYFQRAQDLKMPNTFDLVDEFKARHKSDFSKPQK